ncbi:PstS family phosphate ABC transporter substrate-binding protein [Methanolobus zinderi]|uniref:PstS family phosphate ABC transporter substrate-binding protein n=1 Tax=Methanolobus zinderi TaxID=536044 RepID=A0A7D5E6B8_9EURY|nr:PstS family phosphate ABC transporter substrate-binding protein [Methanolobus zinderi]QLC49773.1 PstS family phosphate ABC transporter substrate-binding protein [Methanolobus zinderi]
MNIKKLFNNEAGVSPIVATLVLVVVAIAGAAAVGTIMGSFSSDVSDSANVGDATGAASTEILIAGSTTVQPVSELLAEAYMDAHQGVKVSVQGGGSGAGVSSVAMGISDIGAASRAVKDSELDKYPDIKTHQIGGSAVVIIANDDLTGLATYNVTKADLADLYINDSKAIDGVTVKAYQRAESSGTEDTFVDFIGDDINDSIEGAVGNAGVLAAVQEDTTGVGFVDFGFADGADDVFIMGVKDGSYEFGSDEITADAIMDEFGADNEYYLHDLTRPLNYLTNGEPTAMQQSFITFARSPGATEYFTEVGYFALNEIA